LQGHFGVILRDLNSFWVIVRRGHISSFQGKRGDFKKPLCEKIAFSERVVACGLDQGQNHTFGGCPVV
jgi:hypothetical protein